MPTVLQHVVLPTENDPDLLPLYLDADTWSTIDGEPVRVASNTQIGDVLGRRSVRVRAGGRTSFGTYFNAFPASYWQHWTGVRQIALTVHTSGPATVLVYRSNGSGISQRVDLASVADDAETTFDLPLTQFSDGGWIWFDVVAGSEDATVLSAEWTTDHSPARTGRASVGITTFNKPDFCVATLAALAESPEALEVIDRIFLIDQGTRRVDQHEGFAAPAAALGDTLEVIAQPNLGGSGGFSRAMVETLRRPESDFVQLLDDDVRIEPEAIRRSVLFGRYATTPTIVGAHMFDLLDRAKLNAWAEVVDEEPFMWRPLHDDVFPHDFRQANLRQSPLLHARMDADYNGWWMCLIPTAVIREVGLALPAFLKWDDAEFCLRAREAGFPTVSLPGAALWHVSWVGKDDAIDWQAYYHARGRLVAALLHSTAPRGGTVLRHSRRADLKHLMMMQYYPTELRHLALEDVLSGPGHLHRTLTTRMPEARALAASFPETVVHTDPDDVPRSRRGMRVFPLPRRGERAGPAGLARAVFTARMLARQFLRAPAAHHAEMPDVEFGKRDADWWRVSHVDSALVSAADGSGTQIYTRDRRSYRRLLRRSLRLHRELAAQWPRLAREYRAALDDLVSEPAWRAHFEHNA
ncbi:glycosyltransferase [Microbacterium sp. ZXX196]|uniref:glycosyltransferase n=1 Tax=Microbacterium sp. ZXX196 TaxID=2609291 RepID=UPI0012B98702|nr:glycosyltransferase [Microbacterium sp. ZXX196]MTE22745.1 glycosyltransferase [Microbacterium sp. ZXX196]